MNGEGEGYRKPSVKATIVALLLIALIIVALAQALNALPAAASDDELLENRGFESGEKSPWQAQSGDFTIICSCQYPDYVRSGTFAARFTVTTGFEGWIYQVVQVMPGEDYTFSGCAIKNNSNIEAVLLRISWYTSGDGTGTQIGQIDSEEQLTGDDPSYRCLTAGNLSAPPSAHSARVMAAVQLQDPTQPTTVYFDDLSFSGPKPPEQPPPRFYGTVSITNSDESRSIPAPDGYTVSARIGDEERESCQILNGEYGPLDVFGEQGDTIRFYVQGIDTGQTRPWQAGEFTELDLTVIDSEPPTMPTNVHKTTPDSDNTPSFTWDPATDALAGVAGYSIKIDDAEWVWIGNLTSWTSPHPLPDGDHTFSVKARDNVDNAGETGQANFGIDTTPPSMPTNVHKTTPDNDNTPSFSWDAATDDLAGVAGYSIRIDDAEWIWIGSVTSWSSPHPLPDGAHTFSVKAIDNVDNEGEAAQADFSIDTTPPSMPINVHKTTPDSDNTPSFSWDPATDALAEVAGYSVKIDDAEWIWIGNLTSWTSPHPVADGNHTFFVKARDNVDNEGEAGQADFSIDTTPPSMPTNVHKTTPDNDNTPSFSWDPATDALAGVAGYSIKIDDAEWIWIGNLTSWTSPHPVADGNHTFFIKAIDNVDNEGEAGQADFGIDTTPPSMPTNVRRTTPDNDNTPSFTWDPVTAVLAEVAGYSVKIDDAEWIWIGNLTSWTSPVPVADGNHTFFVKAIDNLDNEGEAGQVDFGIDTTPPSMPANVHKTTPDSDNTPSFSWNPATDALAGVAGYSIKIDDAEWVWIGNLTSWTSPHPVADGNHTFFVKARDNVDNEGEARQADFGIDTTPPSMPTNVHKTTPDSDNTPSFTWDVATDALAGVAGYSIKIDDAEWIWIGNLTSWTSPHPVADGDHTFSVKAIDNLDNEGEADSVSFSINTTSSDGEPPPQPSPTSGKSWLQTVLAPTLAFMGVVCLILAFWFRKRG